MPPRTRGATKREDTPQENNNGGKRIEKGGKVGKLRKTKDKARKPDANSEKTVGNREIDSYMPDALGINISALTEEHAQRAASSRTKICETIYVGGRQDRSPSSPTREAESIHVAGYEVDVNPLLGENEMADRQVNPAMLDAQDGESGSNSMTSPTGKYEQVTNTMEGVERREGEANPLICRAGSNNHTEGDTPVQNTITGTAEAVDQIETNTSAGTGTVTGKTSLPDSCDEQDQQEIGGTSNIKMKNTIYNRSGSMAVNDSNMNQATGTLFSSLTTVEGVNNLLRDTDKVGKRSRETSNDSSSPKLRARDESPTRKRRRVGGDLKEDSVPTNCTDERNIAELHGIGVSCGVDTGTSKVEMDEVKSNMNVPEVSSDGEDLMIFSKAKTNSGQSNTEFHGMDTMGAVEGASLEAHADRQDSDSDMRELGSDTDVDMACTAETAGIGPKEPEVDGMDSSGEINSRPCEVEKGIPIDNSSMPEVRSDSEVSRPPEEKVNYRQSDKMLQEMNSLDSADFSSSSTGTNKQNCDSNMSEVGIEIEAHTANHGGKPNDEQTNLEFGVTESSGSVETAPMNVDTERQNRDCDIHEEQRNADCNDEKLVSDVDSPSQSPAQKRDPIDVHIDVAQSAHSAQLGCPREPVSPLEERDFVMKYTGISPDDNLRRVELERSCVEKLEMKNAHLLIDMIDSLSSGKADTYYLLAFKMVLLIFPNKSWDHVRDKLPAMMGYATENIMTGLEKRVTDEVYTEYPSDKGVDERIICWNQRLELYKGIEYGSRKLLHPIFSSVSRGVGNEPMESWPLQAEIQERTREPDHYQLFQDYFSDHASRAAFVFQSQQLRLDENRFVISILRQLILREQQSSEAMFRELKDITNAVVTSRMIGVTEATARQDLEMNLFGFDDEESTRDDDEKDREDKEPVGDTTKKEILDDVRETIRHHEKNVSRLEGQYKTSNERLQKLEEGFSQLYSCLFGSNIPYTTNNELENMFSNMQHKVKENLSMTSSQKQENNRLLQQLSQIEKEKKKLQNEKDEWRIKAESMESFCLGMEAKLLPEDPIRKIQNLRVEDSTPDDNDIEMHDSPIIVDYEKTLESINMTLKKENMELKDTITGLKNLQTSESQLQRQVVALTNENDEMKIEFRQLYFRAFGIELPPSSQRPYATIVEKLKDITNNLKAESSKTEIRIQELEQAFEKTSQTLRREQADKSDIQAQLDIKTQALSSLEDALQQTKEEKAWIQKEGDQWKAQIDELENQRKTFQAKLLPVDFTREIEDLEVKISMLNNRENDQDGSDGSARNSILKLKEELAAIKLSMKNKEQSRSALEEEKSDLLKKIASLEESINTERDKNKTASVKIEALEEQLHIQGLNQQKAVRMQTQIMQLEQEIKSIQQKEQNYKDIIEKYENKINGIDDLIETRTEQITEVEQFLKDAETGVREQNQAFVKVKQALEAAQADASNKEETYRSIEQEKIRLKEALEEMEQTISRNNKEVDDLTVQLQDAKREIGNLATTLATVESALDRERTTSASDIEDLSMKIERLEKTKQEYEVSIDASENLHRRLREMEEEERTKAMNVQNAIKRKDDTISRLGKDIENIKEGHIREINRLTEEIRKLNNQLAEENKGNGTVTNVSDRSYAIPELPEVALQKLERWKESGDKFAESQKRIDHVFSTIEGLPSRLEQVLTTHQPSASTDSVAQAARDEILTRLEINVKDLKHAIDRQHISSQENAKSNRTCHSIEEINKLMARVNQQREKLSKELSRLTEQASQLNSGFKDKDKQCNEAVNTLLTYQSKCESEFERLSEIIPVLEIKQLTEQIHELQDQIRALGPELKDKNQDLGTLREDICSIKAQTMTCQGDMKHREIIIGRLPSDIQIIKSKLIDMEKGMVQQQIAYDEWRKSSHNTPTRNTQQDENSNVSKLESQLSDLDHVISQLRDKDRLMNEAQKLQNSTTERDSKLNCLKDTMDWLVEEVRKLQKRIKDSEAEAQERQCDMAKFLRLSTSAWVSQKPAEEASSKLNVNDDCRDELDGLREELGQVEKNIMYFTSTFPPPSGNRFSTVMEERFLGKVPVTERLKVLIERVRYRIDDLQSSLEQAKLNSESAMRPERTRSTIVSQANEVATPVSELNMEFLTPIGQESGIIQSPTVRRPPRPPQHNADIRGFSLPDGSPISGPRSSVNSAFAQTVMKDASKILIAEGHGASHASTDEPGDSRKFEEHALDSGSIRGDLERLRASLIFHLCTMLFSRERTVNVEALREGSRIFSRRTIGKGNLELLEKVIEGYSRQSMKSRGANKELRKITYKGRKAFPDPLLKTYTTIFKTLLILTQHLGINEPMVDIRSMKGKTVPPDKGTSIQEGTRKPKRKVQI